MAIIESVPKVTDILHARKTRFLMQTEKKGYNIGRGLVQYESDLPKLKGRRFTQIIEDKISQGAETVNVLDIGCGKGNALARLVQKYPEVRAFGISAYDYRPEEQSYFGKEYFDKIDYRVGDAQRLAGIFPDVSFDVVVSDFCMQYVNDPLSTLRQAYRRTSPGGVILLDYLGPALTFEQASRLRAYWRQRGITSELEPFDQECEVDISQPYSLAMQKTTGSMLPIPFSYSYAQYGISYSFNEETIPFGDLTTSRS